MSARKGIKAYELFHGKRPRAIKPARFHVPKYLILLGEVREIVYECDKINGGGDGKKALYQHKFKKGTKLYMDERSGKVLYLSGNTMYVNSRGIVN